LIIPKRHFTLAAILLIFLASLGVLLFPRLESKKPAQTISKSESPASSAGIVSSQGLSLGEVLQAGFSLGVEKFSNQGEVRAAKGFKTPQEKRNYLRLLEEYGFRGAEAVAFLKTALNDPDQEVRRAAMRGLGKTETAEAESILMTYAKDGVAIEESTEAALVLGQMTNSAVTGKVENLLSQARDPVLRDHLVDALAGRPWEQTSRFLTEHLRNPNISVEEKQNALAMLGMRDTAPSGILTAALGDSKEEIRAGAYQGLAWRNETKDSAKVRNSLTRETDSGLRGLAYEAWGNQIDAKCGEIQADYRKETQPEVQLRALKAWARAYGRQPVEGNSFASEALGKLEQVAMTDRDPGERKEALAGLQAIGSKESKDALGRIAINNSSARIRNLAKSMSSSSH
jgi:HEAT repeat protein